MDIKDMIAKVEAKIGDKAFQEALKKNPVKAVEELLGVNLPDEQLKAVLAAAKAKLGSADLAGIADGLEEKLGDVLGGAEGKLGGVLSGVKEKAGSADVAGIAENAEEKIGDVLDDAKGLLGGLFGKKD